MTRASSTGIEPGSGNGWVHCRCGHRHWGRFGAAGVLVTDGQQVLLAHRAGWTHQGGSWAVPGGARDRGETAEQAALREAAEETTLDVGTLETFDEWVDDHGDWSYVTLLAHLDQRTDVDVVGQLGGDGQHWQENDDARWWPIDAVDDLPLHPGFGAAWPHLRERIAGRYGSADPLP